MTTLDDLHERQQQLLHYIWQFQEQRGLAPTLDEMCVGLGFSSKSHVNHHLDELEAQRLITRIPYKSRSVRLTDLGLNTLGVKPVRNGLVRLPMLGYIVAGEPVMTGQVMDTVELTRDIVPDQGDLYGLHVRGDSMEGAHIRDGDLVVMRRQDELPRNGDIVAVRLRSTDEVTLKRFYHENSVVRLVPANPAYPVIEIPAADVEVQGQMVAVIRRC